MADPTNVKSAAVNLETKEMVWVSEEPVVNSKQEAFVQLMMNASEANLALVPDDFPGATGNPPPIKFE